ncbi:carbohydrate ABC transporter permease [Streptomyces sp. TBY4]|uniref:carbohydrate ABC transporter permease n=1 Tax=Streptomyces sp. TBY4 TaxID=2962030 RepID=UPI0020B7C4D1|nr:sugar ABC transporter permease [Streptomyces sp. TBY4]MCP3754673.1 sugar ABC transporter permease [Streptomyces sp. TBY4]
MTTSTEPAPGEISARGGGPGDATASRGRRAPRPAVPRTRRPLRTHQPLSPWLFLAPGLLITLAFNLYPFFSTVWKSFTDARTLTPGRFVGFDNFSALLQDERFWVALRNSALYVVVVVPCMVLLPLLLALLVQKQIPGIGFFRSAYYTPVVASVVVVALMWVWMLDDRGFVNGMLQMVGIDPVPFLSNQWLLLLSAMALTVWKGLGYYMIIYLAALANVPRELHEAAEVDGAGPVRRFVSITMPAVRSTMVLVGALSSVSAFKVFSEVYMIAGPTGGPGGEDTTLVMLIQRVGTGLQGRTGYASAMSIVLFVLTLLLMLLVLRADRKEKD